MNDCQWFTQEAQLNCTRRGVVLCFINFQRASSNVRLQLCCFLCWDGMAEDMIVSIHSGKRTPERV